MWRDYLGENARIIGIDLNPEAKIFEKEGFEIFIGDQQSPKFWDYFFHEVGKIDILLDDGGHTNEQQIMTTEKCLENINSFSFSATMLSSRPLPADAGRIRQIFALPNYT